MSYNDRLKEAAIWVNAQPGDTVALPKAAVAAVLWDAKDAPSRWPFELSDWVREPGHRADIGWSGTCWDASIPQDWNDYIDGIGWADDTPEVQPKHADCRGISERGTKCECPCHADGGAA